MFDALGRAGSLTQAAAGLGITAGAASRQLRALEREVGRPLFARVGGRLMPTPDGEALREGVAASFDRLEEAVARLRARDAGPLAVGVLPSFLLLWLVPRLPVLARAHPDLTVVPRPLQGPVELGAAGLDAVVDVGRWPADVDLVRTGFMEDVSGPVLSRALHEELGRPATMDGLLAAPLLEARSRPDLWEPWLAEADAVRVAVARRIGFDHLLYALEAARAGLGVAVGPTAYLHGALATGELVTPLGLRRGVLGYHVAWSRHRGEDPRLRTFVAWLRAEGAATPTDAERVAEAPAGR